MLGGLLLAAFISSTAFAQSMSNRYVFGAEIGPEIWRNISPFRSTVVVCRLAAAPQRPAQKCLPRIAPPATVTSCREILKKGVGGDRLLGGRGTLATTTPIKTVESYWPYATTLFDYVKRAMPSSAPGSLSDDDVYSVVAYILSEAKIIKPTDAINAETLPKVGMPNRDGFTPDVRPELQLYR